MSEGPSETTAERPIIPPPAPGSDLAAEQRAAAQQRPASPSSGAPQGSPYAGQPGAWPPAPGQGQSQGQPQGQGQPAGQFSRPALAGPDETADKGPGFAERVQSRIGGMVSDFRSNREARNEGEPISVQPRSGESAVVRKRQQTRRARLRLTRIDPWSAMKTGFLLSIALAVVVVVAVLVVWSVLGAAGVWDSINATIQSVLGDQATSNFDVRDYVSTSRVLGFTLLVSIFDILLITTIATLSAFIYNMAAALLGGLEVTLAEEDR